MQKKDKVNIMVLATTSTQEYFMSEKRILSRNTLQSYEIAYEKFVNFVEDEKIKDIDIFEKVKRFILHRRNIEKKRKSTLVRDRAAIYYYLKDEMNFTRKEIEYLNTIILNATYKNPNDKTFTKDGFTQKQALYFLDKLSEKDEEMFLIVYLTLAAGGRRISEIMNLRKQDVSINKKDIIITINESKTEKQFLEKKGIDANINNIGSRLKMHIYKQNLKNTDYIFCNDRMSNKQIHVKIGRRFNRLLKIVKYEDVKNILNIDLKYFSFHSLRATFVSNCMSDRQDTYKTMAMTGHKSLKIFNMYDKRITKYAEKNDMYELNKHEKEKIIPLFNDKRSRRSHGQ